MELRKLSSSSVVEGCSGSAMRYGLNVPHGTRHSVLKPRHIYHTTTIVAKDIPNRFRPPTWQQPQRIHVGLTSIVSSETGQVGNVINARSCNRGLSRLLGVLAASSCPKQGEPKPSISKRPLGTPYEGSLMSHLQRSSVSTGFVASIL